jgi:hypothetical protein
MTPMPLVEEIHRYDYGSRINHILRIEMSDEPADPDSLRVYFYDPLGVQTGPFTPTRDGKGLYSYQKTYTSTQASSVGGTWSLLWIGSGNADGGKVRRHYINPMPFTGV